MRRENDVSLRAVSRLLSYTREWRIRRAKRFGVKESVEKRASLRARFHARGYAARLCSCEQPHRNESISFTYEFGENLFSIIISYVCFSKKYQVCCTTNSTTVASEIQLGKEDTHKHSLTPQRNLPSKGRD